MATITADPKTKKVPASAHAVQDGAESLPQKFPLKAVTKTTDSKGRVALGGRFANRPVIIQTLSETEMIIKLARVIPESEVWLYDNPEALAAVRSGLAHARAGNLTVGPDVDADAKLVAELEG